jgi:beta-fructofuranosidase
VHFDQHRPQYHFLPEANWMNDPNGLIQWGDTYHMFYQYNPNGPFHGTIHWGHATSTDLVHWQHEPIALAPDEGGPDAHGCWSGYALNNNGMPTLIYSGNRNSVQLPCMATSDDDLRTWHKYPGNPLIPAPPEGLDLLAWRDHTLWQERDGWHMLMGAGIRDQGGAVLHFRSVDLVQWEYLGPLLQGDLHEHQPIWTGPIWECPDFFALGEQQVLVISVCDYSAPHSNVAFVGHYKGVFTPTTLHTLDHGRRYFYAPLSFPTSSGRRIMFGWIPEGRNGDAQRAAGWSGVMSLPRELFISSEGKLAMRPIEELQQLRKAQRTWEQIDISTKTLTMLDDQAGNNLELNVELLPGQHGSCGVVVCCSPDGQEQTRIWYNLERGQLVLDRSLSSLDSEVDHENHTAPLALAVGELLRLQIFLDGSVIEVFANDRFTITSRIYPTKADAIGIGLFAEQTSGLATRVDSWQMKVRL